MSPPEHRPEGVRIRHEDGSTTPCDDLTYVGLDARGNHLWQIITSGEIGPGDRLLVAVMPPHTGLTLTAEPVKRTDDGA